MNKTITKYFKKNLKKNCVICLNSLAFSLYSQVILGLKFSCNHKHRIYTIERTKWPKLTTAFILLIFLIAKTFDCLKFMQRPGNKLTKDYISVITEILEKINVGVILIVNQNNFRYKKLEFKHLMKLLEKCNSYGLDVIDKKAIKLFIIISLISVFQLLVLTLWCIYTYVFCCLENLKFHTILKYTANIIYVYAATGLTYLLIMVSLTYKKILENIYFYLEATLELNKQNCTIRDIIYESKHNISHYEYFLIDSDGYKNKNLLEKLSNLNKLIIKLNQCVQYHQIYKDPSFLISTLYHLFLFISYIYLLLITLFEEQEGLINILLGKVQVKLIHGLLTIFITCLICDKMIYLVSIL